jgi:hypothetical protein
MFAMYQISTSSRVHLHSFILESHGIGIVPLWAHLQAAAETSYLRVDRGMVRLCALPAHSASAASKIPAARFVRGRPTPVVSENSRRATLFFFIQDVQGRGCKPTTRTRTRANTIPMAVGTRAKKAAPLSKNKPVPLRCLSPRAQSIVPF